MPRKSFTNTFDESKSVISEMLGSASKTLEKKRMEERSDFNIAQPINIRQWEKRSECFRLLLTPSLHERVKIASKTSGAKSVNDYISAILEKMHPVGGRG
jgi:predicted HicB family RNase H-like nuclease